MKKQFEEDCCIEDLAVMTDEILHKIKQIFA